MISIIFITLNSISKHLLHASQMRMIHTHIYEEFMIWSRIQAYKGLYECLWTLVDPDMYMRHVDIFSHYSLCFSFLISSQKTLSLPISSTIAWQTFSIITASCMTSPPLYSPVICKDNFPLVYMYKLSRYYLVFDINLGSIFPWSTIL